MNVTFDNVLMIILMSLIIISLIIQLINKLLILNKFSKQVKFGMTIEDIMRMFGVPQYQESGTICNNHITVVGYTNPYMYFRFVNGKLKYKDRGAYND